MLLVIRLHLNGLKYPLYASLTLSFASFGDAFLYPFLPQYAEVMQVPVVWIGVLLSVNRFIRIGFNPIVVILFSKYGVRPTIISASLLAVVSTFGYALGLGLISLLLFRLMWGISYAILRIGALTYAFEHKNAGISLGASKSLQELGPLFSLWMGPLLVNYFSGQGAFIILAVISVPSLSYSLKLSDLDYLTSKQKVRIGLPSLFNSMTFLVSFIAEGMLIVVIGNFLSRHYPNLTYVTITVLAAGFLGYRRICCMLLSPISGAIADKVGFTKVFTISLLFMIIGLLILLNGYTMEGLAIIFYIQ